MTTCGLLPTSLELSPAYPSTSRYIFCLRSDNRPSQRHRGRTQCSTVPVRPSLTSGMMFLYLHIVSDIRLAAWFNGIRHHTTALTSALPVSSPYTRVARGHTIHVYSSALNHFRASFKAWRFANMFAFLWQLSPPPPLLISRSFIPILKFLFRLFLSK